MTKSRTTKSKTVKHPNPLKIKITLKKKEDGIQENAAIFGTPIGCTLFTLDELEKECDMIHPRLFISHFALSPPISPMSSF